MNIEHLRLFLRIAALHNISQAGAEMGLSPALASAHINKLEENLGVRLIHRTTRKVSLTEEGQVFLLHAEDVLASVEAAKASIGAGNTSPTGTLRVAAPASFGRMHLLPGLVEFMQQYPNLKVDLKLSDSIVDLVEGGFDVAIRNAELKDSSLIARKLTHDNRIVCASPDYISLNGAPEKPIDLKKHNCITLLNLDNWVFSKGSDIFNIKVSGSFRTDNGEAIRDACSQGLGVTINSTWSCYQQLVSGQLQQLLSDYSLASQTAIWAVYPSSRQLAPKVRCFIDFFTKYFEGTPYWDRALANHTVN
ncbi:LysR family transcriptional regulator [Alteromonas sp. ASW11-130]|uniref:LysR family transcriptional regulator n=1 Tax=Alteromonas sp. ASW11-130 TaxID=3015775 RepID=UPI002241FDC5|nr:LysR family transcriptional regulator [Alteromonas sp. ASW11-130]MCW8093095.1 LysR family transcriptional regulator [Alteromonas sp. ASW11-130]